MLTLCCYRWEIPFVISLWMMWLGWNAANSTSERFSCGSLSGQHLWEGSVPPGHPGWVPGAPPAPAGAGKGWQEPPGSFPNPQRSSSLGHLAEGGTGTPRGHGVTSQGLNVTGKDWEIPGGWSLSQLPSDNPWGTTLPEHRRKGAQDRGSSSSLQLENIDEIKHLIIVTVVDFWQL